MMPDERVATAKPVSIPAVIVAGHDGTICLAITMTASVAAVIASRKGTSIGVKKMLP
ncbi:MAG: hypothetical protein WB822_12470 [Rhodoplanes sp.]